MSGAESKRAIDRIIAHYAATKDRRVCIKSAVWGFDIWCAPWTLGEKDRVFGSGEGWRPRTTARMLIVKALDANGKHLFADVEEAELLNEADPDEVARVAAEMLRLLNADNEAASEEGAGAKN